jgi:hypothetical protein
LSLITRDLALTYGCIWWFKLHLPDRCVFFHILVSVELSIMDGSIQLR